MIEAILAITNVLMVGGILTYFYLKEIRNKKDDNERITALDSFYSRAIEKLKEQSESKDTVLKKLVEDSSFAIKEISKSKDTALEKLVADTNASLKEISKSKDATLNKAFADYLKHIERLEKMVLPKPITKKMIEEVYSHTPPMAENEIEKTNDELQNENLMDMLGRIPITSDTKVAFEGDVNDLSTGLSEEILETGESEAVTPS